MLLGHTMGQFINLPDGTMLVINGAVNGTATFSNQTLYPIARPDAIFPVACIRSRRHPWYLQPKRTLGFALVHRGSIARMYHLIAILLPDASVLIAGSNPNINIELTSPYLTTYTAEIFYPSYFSSSVHPQVMGVPQTLGYGGPYYFNLTVSSTSYTGTSANDAAANTTVVLARGRFTTHAMNMGQRDLHVRRQQRRVLYPPCLASPPKPELVDAWTLLFVVVNGIPSNGMMVIIGTGNVEAQLTAAAAVLLAVVTATTTEAQDGEWL